MKKSELIEYLLDVEGDPEIMFEVSSKYDQNVKLVSVDDLYDLELEDDENKDLLVLMTDAEDTLINLN